MSNPMAQDAVQALTDRHRPATYNEYGSPIVAGFGVSDGAAGSVRVTHTTPPPDLLDPERPSDDELAEAGPRGVSERKIAVGVRSWIPAEDPAPLRRLIVSWGVWP